MIKSTQLMNPLHRVVWRSVILDEGHRIKNLETDMSKACGRLRSRFKVILTGTPVQNNMGETYALLHFLMPRVFDAREVFDDCFALTVKEIKVDRPVLNNAHYMLRPFVLRRIKTEVEQKLPPKIETMVHCPMSEMQKFWTRMLLMKDAAVLSRLGAGAGAVAAAAAGDDDQTSTSSASSGSGSGSGPGSSSSSSSSSTAAPTTTPTESTKGQDWKKLQSLLAQLRKAANHPYLFPGAETDPEADGGSASEEIVTASGKLVMLDRMLTKLKERGHRVVIFSQYTRTLDILSGE
jgi:SWI/SNF-related matrix-associated actin-dependent regulator of chromatin subfamily A member 5